MPLIPLQLCTPQGDSWLLLECQGEIEGRLDIHNAALDVTVRGGWSAEDAPFPSPCCCARGPCWGKLGRRHGARGDRC